VPFDEDIKHAIDTVCHGMDGLTSKRMFGGVGYLYHGNMAFGVYADSLIVRLGSHEKAKSYLESGEARPFDITGRPMKGWVMVSKSRLATARDYQQWVDMGLAFAKSLPPK
jgi:TfoX/Sxy family transcriptional regulator of competence genes